MTSDTFGQLMDAYLQQTIEMNVSSIASASVDATQTWVQLLQRHVQEWKRHYGLESQAVERVRENYQHIRRQVGPLSPSAQMAMLEAESQESNEVSLYFQAKRDLIWARQQQELNTSRFVS